MRIPCKITLIVRNDSTLLAWNILERYKVQPGPVRKNITKKIDLMTISGVYISCFMFVRFLKSVSFKFGHLFCGITLKY